MRIFPSDAARLHILNGTQPRHPWKTVKEKRHCIACQRSFSGRQVIVRWVRCGVTHLKCPTPHCESRPHHWVRTGNPLVNESVWLDWELAMAAAFAGEDQMKRAT
jgi:hypothetical protein